MSMLASIPEERPTMVEEQMADTNILPCPPEAEKTVLILITLQSEIMAMESPLRRLTLNRDIHPKKAADLKH